MKENIHPELAALTVRVDQLKHYGKNPRRGDVAAIAESLEENGQYKAIVVRAGTNEVLAGNHTLRAARELGWEHIAATFVNVDDDRAARIVLVDNRTNDLAGYDDAELKALLEELPDLKGTGFDVDAFEALGVDMEQEPADAPDSADDVPAERREGIAQPGDLFVLGDHRVICGDSTRPEVLARLMDGDTANMMWTDPPYGVDYVGKTEDALTIENDGAAGLDKLLGKALAAAATVLRPGAPVYMAGPQGPQIQVFQEALQAAGYLWRQNLVWVKNTMVLGRSDYHYKHEPILEGQAPGGQDQEEAGPEGKTYDPIMYGFTPGGAGRLGRGGPKWYGGNSGTTVFEFDKPAASRMHPTMKPVKLILAMLANSARPGHVVLDPFAGSGSTLMAAHFHGAHARVVELDPKYVDVICARWQAETGVMPRRGGHPVDFLQEV